MKAFAITPIVVIIVLAVIAGIGILTLSTTKGAGLEQLLSGTVNCGIEGKQCCGGFYCSGGLVCSDNTCAMPRLEVTFDDSKFVYNASDFDYFEQNYNYTFLTTGAWREDLPNDISKISELKEECYPIDLNSYMCYECERFYNIENRTISSGTSRDAPYNCFDCDYCNSTTKSCERCSICTDYKNTSSGSLPGTDWQDIPDSRDSYQNLTDCYACTGSEGFDDSGFSAEKSTECGLCETGDVKQTVSDLFNCAYCAQYNGTNYTSCFGCKARTKEYYGDGDFRCKVCNVADPPGSYPSFSCEKQSEFKLCERLKACFAESQKTGETCDILEDVPIKATEENKFKTDLQGIIDTCLGKEIIEPLSYGFKQTIGSIKPYENVSQYKDYGQKMTSFWNCGGYSFDTDENRPILAIRNNSYIPFSSPAGYYYTISAKATDKYQGIYFCKQPTLTDREDDPILEIPKKLRGLDFSNESTWPEGASLQVLTDAVGGFDNYMWDEESYQYYSSDGIMYFFYVNFTEPFHIKMDGTKRTSAQIADAVVSGMMQWNILGGQINGSTKKLCEKIKESIRANDVKDKIYPPACMNAKIIDNILYENLSDGSLSMKFNATWSMYDRSNFPYSRCSGVQNATIFYWSDTDSCDNWGLRKCYKDGVYILPTFVVIYSQPNNCDGSTGAHCFNQTLNLVPVFGIAEDKYQAKNICDPW